MLRDGVLQARQFLISTILELSLETGGGALLGRWVLASRRPWLVPHCLLSFRPFVRRTAMYLLNSFGRCNVYLGLLFQLSPWVCLRACTSLLRSDDSLPLSPPMPSVPPSADPSTCVLSLLWILRGPKDLHRVEGDQQKERRALSEFQVTLDGGIVDDTSKP